MPRKVWHEPQSAIPGKKRYQQFYEYMAQELLEKDVEEAALCAARRMQWMGWRGYALTEKALKKKVEVLLARPDTPAGIRQAFEKATGFDTSRAMQKVVDWIEGDVVGPDGEKLPPSERMLTKYLDVALPKPAKQVNVDQRMVVAKLNMGEAPPVMRARVLDVKPALESRDD